MIHHKHFSIIHKQNKNLSYSIAIKWGKVEFPQQIIIYYIILLEEQS